MRRRALERLEEHQAAIRAIIGDGEPMLTDAPGDVAEIARVRWTLMRALTAYQLFKHRELFDPVIAAGGARALHAARLKAACNKLGDAYRDHVQRWSATDVEGNWPDYRPAAAEMIARIRGHMVVERAEAAALLASG